MFPGSKRSWEPFEVFFFCLEYALYMAGRRNRKQVLAEGSTLSTLFLQSYNLYDQLKNEGTIIIRASALFFWHLLVCLLKGNEVHLVWFHNGFLIIGYTLLSSNCKSHHMLGHCDSTNCINNKYSSYPPYFSSHSSSFWIQKRIWKLENSAYQIA